jgi:hypothetical protein
MEARALEALDGGESALAAGGADAVALAGRQRWRWGVGCVAGVVEAGVEGGGAWWYAGRGSLGRLAGCGAGTRCTVDRPAIVGRCAGTTGVIGCASGSGGRLGEDDFDEWDIFGVGGACRVVVMVRGGSG